MARPHPLTAAIRNRSPPTLCIFFRSGGPTHKTHGHLRIPSTPGVRDRSRCYRLFPARRAMHAKRIKIRHVVQGQGCGSPHIRLTGDARGWAYAGGGSAIVWRLVGGLNHRTRETPVFCLRIPQRGLGVIDVEELQFWWC